MWHTLKQITTSRRQGEASNTHQIYRHHPTRCGNSGGCRDRRAGWRGDGGAMCRGEHWCRCRRCGAGAGGEWVRGGEDWSGGECWCDRRSSCRRVSGDGNGSSGSVCGGRLCTHDANTNVSKCRYCFFA